MDDKRNIIRDLNIVSVKGKKRYYTLSYSLQEENSDKKLFDPQKMDSEEIIWYVRRYYKEDKNFGKSKLINDLIIFKSYKDDLEIKRSLQSFFIASITGIITITIALISLNIDLKNFQFENLEKNNKTIELEIPDTSMIPKMNHLDSLLDYLKYMYLLLINLSIVLKASIYITAIVLEFIFNLFKNELEKIFIILMECKEAFVVILLIVICIIVTFIYYLFVTRKKSSYNKIKTLNNVIYYLEEINKSLE
ncbi:hypothetical protein [uncultured Peptoniphilus sp.]|uniref:hypothetical protein n=1 Tax=uncultured Peptoniphilus sp. TaxID=254354 RepID=UPI0025D65DFD|nr:hypothetical protein [uncultured Peptoniphilus sp.]